MYCLYRGCEGFHSVPGSHLTIYKNGASLHSFKLDSTGSLNGYYAMMWRLDASEGRADGVGDAVHCVDGDVKSVGLNAVWICMVYPCLS